jgi:23S rRNA (cytosine1962-C5)-methyltransferase
MQDEPFDAPALARRLAASLERRRPLLIGGERDAYRVVHGEADLLPGLFADRYADAVVLQTATRAMDRRKPLLASLLKQLLPIDRVLVRDDGSARDMENLPRERGFLIGGPSSTARFHDAGSTMEADLLLDRKTGSFLDQQDNHAEVASWAQLLCPSGGQALDAFTYHGGFALALARAGLGVIACDEDPVAIGRARNNAELSQVTVDFHVHNAFDLLRAYESEGRRFDVVVIDPPALAKRGRTAGLGQSAMTQALRAYKELNLRALRILRPGGLLATCSCSGRVTVEDFSTMLRSAAQDAGRPLQLLWRRGAGIDHPVLWGLPESEYLKCWLFRVLA